MSLAPDDAAVNKKTVAQLLQKLFGERRIDAVDVFLSPEYSEIEPFAGQKQGRAGFREFFGGLIDAFPDLHWKLDGQVAEDDRVVSWGTWNGTHKGEFAGLHGTNRRARVSIMMVHKLENGLVVEGLTMADVYGLMQQLGDIPPPGGTRPYRF
jgi:steroid delta-isomerase-like uncharacterized protein